MINIDVKLQSNIQNIIGSIKCLRLLTCYWNKNCL